MHPSRRQVKVYNPQHFAHKAQSLPQQKKGAFREMSDMILHAQGKDEVYTSAKGFLKSVKNMGQ